MGKMQNHWFQPTQLQEHSLLQLESGHAQAAYGLDAVNAVTQAQIALLKDGVKFLSGARLDANWTFGLPVADYESFAASQAAFAQAVSQAGVQFYRQTSTLGRSYREEQKRQIKGMLSA
jgi:hypothetical protein